MTANKELFLKAFSEADLLDMQKYQTKADFKHEFSEAFEKKMSRLIAKESRISFNTRKKLTNALLAAIIAVLVLITGLMSVSASREKIVEFVERVFSTNTQITLSENSAPTPETIEKAYTLGYVPEGFVLKSYDVDELAVYAICENSISEIIVFEQYILNMNSSISNEDYYKKIKLNGYDAYVYGIENNICISWSDGEYWFTINALTKFKDELLTIAEKIIEKK